MQRRRKCVCRCAVLFLLCFVGILCITRSFADCSINPDKADSARIFVNSDASGENSIVNDHGQYIVKPTLDMLSLHRLGSNIFAIERTDTDGHVSYALCDIAGFITDFRYTYIDTEYTDNAPILAVNTEYQYGFIDASGQWIIQPTWFYAEPFSEGKAYVQSETALGYIDQNGRYLLEFTYDQISTAESFSEGVAAVQFADGFWGYIDSEGNKAIDQTFQEASSFRDGAACVKDKQGYFYVDHQGREITNRRFSYAADFLYGYAIVRDESNSYGVLSIDGNYAFPAIANCIISITPDQLCWVCTEDSTLFQLYDLSSGTFVCRERYEMPFDDGFPYNGRAFIVKNDDLYGVLSNEGEMLIPCQYDSLFFDDAGNLCGPVPAI